MTTPEAYHAQVALLLRVLPLIDEEPSFALKGGTAINLFMRDLPRLSVDIDLTYWPVEDRRASLALLSFKNGEPAWDLLGLPEARHLPAVRWKLDNLAKLSTDKRAKLLAGLARLLAS